MKTRITSRAGITSLNTLVAAIALATASLAKCLPVQTPISDAQQPLPEVLAWTGTAPVLKPTMPEFPALEEELPSGLEIPGHPGYVFSPYDNGQRVLDVRGLPAGTEVICPVTGMHFRVPGEKDANLDYRDLKKYRNRPNLPVGPTNYSPFDVDDSPEGRTV